jgi:SmpA / OmlA family
MWCPACALLKVDPKLHRTGKSDLHLWLQTLRWVLYSTLFVLVVGGCTQKSAVRNQSLMNLQMHMTREEVRSTMGEPHAIETRGSVEFWVYASDEQDSGNSVPIGFVNGRVAGWGRTYYEGAMSGNTAVDGALSRRQ